jgi:hypothetical protein
MRYDIYGGYEIERKPNRLGVFDKAFWDRVREDKANLPEACGCYVFALQNGNNIRPWYVGKTEKRTFQKECFQSGKIVIYNEVLANLRGISLLFLLPRLTKSMTKFSKHTKSGYRDVDFLETMVIGMALERNGKLANARKTKFLRKMKVPGVINSPQARPKRSVSALRKTLGLRGNV